jgi:hypothetical protein
VSLTRTPDYRSDGALSLQEYESTQSVLPVAESLAKVIERLDIKEIPEGLLGEDAVLAQVVDKRLRGRFATT